MSIDWEELDYVQDGNQGWRVALSSDLSSVYVPGQGSNPKAFIIGKAPDAQEEAQRRPFVGPAGIVMRDLMAIAKLFSVKTFVPWDSGGGTAYAPNCWLTNVVKFRPPRNRKPTPLEIQAARPWLRAEWKAVGSPRLIIPVGSTALEAVTGKKSSILLAAGKCHGAISREGYSLHIWPMVHPSFGIRGGPHVQELLEKDWENLAEWMRDYYA